MYRVIIASVDLKDDEFMDFDLFDGFTYEISCSRTAKYTLDPVEAIRCWFDFCDQGYTDSAIRCIRKSDAIALCEVATDQYLTKLYRQYSCPYRLDSLIRGVKKQLANGCRSFYENRYGDMVYPFDVG